MNKLLKDKTLNLLVSATLLMNIGLQPVANAEATKAALSEDGINYELLEEPTDANIDSESILDVDSMLDEDDEESNELYSQDARLLIRYIDKDGEKFSGDNKIYVNQYLDAVILDAGTDIESYVEELMVSNDNIEFVQRDYKLILSATEEDGSEPESFPQADELIENPDSVDNVDINNYRGGVVIAVIDSGIDTSHEAIRDNIWQNEAEISDETDTDGNGYIDDVAGWDFVDSEPLSYDESKIVDYSHGTHIAGIIAGTSNEIQGVCPEAKIMPLRVFKDGSAYTSDVIRAIEYAESMGADIVNCSFCSNDENPALQNAIANYDMLFICAAGNHAKNIDESPVYPASYDLSNVISVAATDGFDNLAYFSNYGDSVDIAAPGLSIKSSIPENEYGNSSGTSSATAYITGIAADTVLKTNDTSINSVKEAIFEKSKSVVILNDA